MRDNDEIPIPSCSVMQTKLFSHTAMSDCTEVSVLIPAYNMSDHVGGAVASVLRDDLSEMEVIVLNDGSTDDTEQSVEPFTDPDHPTYDPRVRLHTHENRWKPATFNRGFRLSQESYIVIVDADDAVPPAGITARIRIAAGGQQQRRARFSRRLPRRGRACARVRF